MTTTRKWARHVHVRVGALKGWCAKCPADQRRNALRSVVKKDGYAAVIRRLNFLRNVAGRRKNSGLRTVAERDVHWMERALPPLRPSG
jgi:hypothetical protein